ncbi:MAG: DUF1684 domain-containing protein [Bifidobacteriaceae bacterium]|jgi:uncharacterized protein (DUF1684 family)|nr:DUF1684 domain-containing protein [Bifidobacteriaceae bacterium]
MVRDIVINHLKQGMKREAASATYQQITAQPAHDFEEEFHRWHDDRESVLSAPHGWLSLASIDWLADGEKHEIPDFPGYFLQEGTKVTYVPDGVHEVTNKEIALTEPFTLDIPETGDYNVEDFDFGDVRAQLIKRIGDSRQYAVRVRNPHSENRTTFTGIPTFEPDQKWVFPARYVPSNQWETSEVGASVGTLSHDETTIGWLYFTIASAQYRLAVFQGHNDDSGLLGTNDAGETVYLDNRTDTEGMGFVLFRDATSGKETYGGVRALTFDTTHPERVTYIDFNRSWNLPCAYSDYCTCPFAPASNQLPFAIRAGEKKVHD